MRVILDKLLASLSPLQVCWLCLAVTAMLAAYGARTYASTASLADVSRQLSDMRIEQLRQQAFDLHVKACEATKAGQPARPYREQLAVVLESYQKLTRQRIDLPDCSEL